MIGLLGLEERLWEPLGAVLRTFRLKSKPDLERLDLVQ
jgi:hypothetical protein